MNTTSRIVFIDDEPFVLRALRRTLRSQRDIWQMSFFDDPKLALEHIKNEGADVIVTDVRMPYVSGFDVIQQVQKMPEREDIPIIVLTGNGEADQKRRALDLGAADLLCKPVDAEDLVARLRSAVHIKRQQDQLKDYNQRLEFLVAERTRELQLSRLDILWRLGKAAEYRDEKTGYHITRVGLYSKVLAEAMGLDKQHVESIFLAAPLHDVGKIGIPDGILLKKGGLTADEWRIMKGHAEIGAKILSGDPSGISKLILDGPIDFKNPLLEIASTIALCHHEKWDGSGYPRGLVGEQIPIEGRIVAFADVYDALGTARSYKKAFSPEVVHQEMLKSAGHFDPKIVEVWQNTCQQEFRNIAKRYEDI